MPNEIQRRLAAILFADITGYTALMQHDEQDALEKLARFRDALEVKTAEFQLASLGSFEFKNVDEPMAVFALANDGFPVPKREQRWTAN